MIAFHYSQKQLLKGDIITSSQHKYITYEIFWPIYSEVCREILNKELPKEYGYAYPVKKDRFSKKSYNEVESEEFIVGNFNHSLYLMMEQLPSDWKKLPTLKERLSARKECIKEQAIQYFTNIQDINQQELISSSWKIQ